MRVPGPGSSLSQSDGPDVHTEITASNLLKVDLKGRKVNPSRMNG
jgi:hypothetical protein